MRTLCLAVAAVLLGSPAAAIDPQSIREQTTGLRAEVLRLALEVYDNAESRGLVRRKVLTVIDYELPSYERRLWVIDLERGQVLHHEWVAHGMGRPRGSGGSMERAVSFSNEKGTLKSSLGLYLSAEPYLGRHGHSLRLDGLERGVNDNARERAIVLHGAQYVTEARAESRLVGRSWGCPVVRQEIATPLIDAIEGGSLLWIYYPDPQWLLRSEFRDPS